MKSRVGKRIMVTVMAVMLLMATSVTSFAKGLYTSTVYGSLEKVGSKGAQAYTKNMQDHDGSAYAKITIEYMSSLGNMYTTTPITKTAKTSATASKVIETGSFVSAWSGHGVTRQEFELIISG